MSDLAYSRMWFTKLQRDPDAKLHVDIAPIQNDPSAVNRWYRVDELEIRHIEFLVKLIGLSLTFDDSTHDEASALIYILDQELLRRLDA